jgi:hypothetical protein
MKTFAEIVAEEDAQCAALATQERLKFQAGYDALTPEEKQAKHDAYDAKYSDVFTDQGEDGEDD